MKVPLLSALALLLLGACQSYVPPGEVRPGAVVQMNASEFEADTSLRGVAVGYAGVTSGSHFIRSWIGKQHIVPEHQLYVRSRYNGDWKLWQRANGPGAQQLEFVSISTDVDCGRYGCTLFEDFGIGLPDSLLRARIDSGYALKVYAGSGDELILRVTPAQIAAQLHAIDSLRTARTP